jgi:type VI protein secretion system component VasF
MDPIEDQRQLLTEIRDILGEQLAEYRRVTSQALEIQRRAVHQQEQIGRLYKFALVGVVLLVVAAIWYFSRFPIGQ